MTDVELVFVHNCDIYKIITGQPPQPWPQKQLAGYGDTDGQHQLFKMNFLPPHMFSEHVVEYACTSTTPTTMNTFIQ